MLLCSGVLEGAVCRGEGRGLADLPLHLEMLAQEAEPRPPLQPPTPTPPFTRDPGLCPLPSVLVCHLRAI